MQVGLLVLRKVDSLFYKFKLTVLSESIFQDGVKQIVVGICAMSKKTQSKPMQDILTRLEMFEFITVNVFDEMVILEKPVTEWPKCDCLISFQSTGMAICVLTFCTLPNYIGLYRPI